MSSARNARRWSGATFKDSRAPIKNISRNSRPKRNKKSRCWTRRRVQHRDFLFRFGREFLEIFFIGARESLNVAPDQRRAFRADDMIRGSGTLLRNLCDVRAACEVVWIGNENHWS